MEKNVGGYDRIARFVLGPALLVVGIAALGGLVTLAAGTLGTALAVGALLVGAVLSVTATTRKCPLNSVLGVNTYERRSAEDAPTDEHAPRTGAN